jgi:hypothetical protein
MHVRPPIGHGIGMGAVLVPVIIVAIIVVLAVVAVRAFSRREVEHSDQLQAAHRHSVRYEVQPGQDPAAVLHHLESEGYDVSPDSEPGPSSPVLIIGTQDASAIDRDQLRRTLAGFDQSNINPEESGPVGRREVRFVDE